MIFQEFLEHLKSTCKDTSEIRDFLSLIKIGYTKPSKLHKLQINSVGIVLHLTRSAISEAIQKKVDVILPLFLSDFWNQTRLTDEMLTLNRLLLKEQTMVIQIPHSWLYCEEGMLDTICEMLSLQVIDVIHERTDVLNFPIGRVCNPKSQPFSYPLLFDLIKNDLGVEHFRFYIDNRKDAIEKVLVILERIQMNSIQIAKEIEADLILGSALTYETSCACENAKINVIDLTKYAMNVGLSKLAKVLSIQMPEVQFFFLKSDSTLSYL